MSKINIKIVEVDQASHTVVVKYSSEDSLKSIDEYPAVAFQVTNYSAKTLDEFIEAIRPTVSLYVWQRDQMENPSEIVDISTWGGHLAVVDRYVPPVDPALSTQLIPAQQSSEVVL
jgi:hypothetical protein